jgi:hypothetical protein
MKDGYGVHGTGFGYSHQVIRAVRLEGFFWNVAPKNPSATSAIRTVELSRPLSDIAREGIAGPRVE